MGYINQPPELFGLFADLEARLRKLETAQRFTAPNVNITTNAPSNPRVGDIYYDLELEYLVYWNGTLWHKLNQSTY
jgi:hypothetical protein